MWVDRPTRLRNTWFGFLAFVIVLLKRLCLTERPFLYDKFGLAMVVAVLGTTSSLRFFYDLELLGGIVLRRTKFVSLFCFVGRGLVSFLEISLLEVCF